MDIKRLLVDNVDPVPASRRIDKVEFVPCGSQASLVSTDTSSHDSEPSSVVHAAMKPPRRRRNQTSERPSYVCEDCGASFVWKHGLRRHRLVVEMGKRDFACEYCHRQFGERGNLIKHIRYTHLRLKPFSCPVCQVRFSKRDHCRRHMSVLHPQFSVQSMELKDSQLFASQEYGAEPAGTCEKEQGIDSVSGMVTRRRA